MNEYLHALNERSRKQMENTLEIPKVGKVVLLKEDIKNRALWRMGRVIGTVAGRDGVRVLCGGETGSGSRVVRV